jgi:hypothetical protein
MKILCTGNPVAGIAKELQSLYPDTCFISRTNGYDLSTIEGIDKFKELLPNYDVFINHSQLLPGTQQLLLQHAYAIWNSGHVINIGSVLEFKQWEWIEPDAAEDKRQLRERSLALGNELFKTTHLIIGGIRDNDICRMHPVHVAKAIMWILENEVHIPMLYIDKLSNEVLSKRKY